MSSKISNLLHLSQHSTLNWSWRDKLTLFGVVHILYNALDGGGVVSNLLCALYKGMGLFLLMLYNTLHRCPIFRQTVY